MYKLELECDIQTLAFTLSSTKLPSGTEENDCISGGKSKSCGASPTALSALSAVAADPAAAAGRLAPPTVAGTVADANPETTSVMVRICCCISAICSCRVTISAGGVNGGASFSRPRSGRVLFALTGASSPYLAGAFVCRRFFGGILEH